MGSLDTVSLVILLGSLLVLAGILSSLIAIAFRGAAAAGLPFGWHAGWRDGPGGIKFDDVGVAYTVGSIALALFCSMADCARACASSPQCPGARRYARNGGRAHYAF